MVTGDDTWVYGYGPQTKQQSLQWKSPNSPRPKIARQVRSNAKYMLIFFFSTSKALSKRNSYPLVKPSMASFTVRFWSGWGRAFGANLQTSGRIGFSTMTTRPPTHHSLFDNSWLPKTLQWFPISHPTPTPYSPDLAPCDFFLFPKMKLRLKWCRFDTTEEIHADTQEVIDIHLRTSRDAWNNGKHAGIAVYMPKETTSKETVKTRSYGKKLFLMGKFPEFLGSHTYTLKPHNTGNIQQLNTYRRTLAPYTYYFRTEATRSMLIQMLVGSLSPHITHIFHRHCSASRLT